MTQTRIGYTCQMGDPMAFSEAECLASGGNWIGQEVPAGVPDFGSITGGGFNNTIDNADSFLRFPGQDKLNSISSLGTSMNASHKIGYTNPSQLNLAGFVPNDQVKIKAALSKIDTLANNTSVCSQVVQNIVDKNVTDVPKNTAILDAYKTASKLIDCGEGLDVVMKGENLLDEFTSTSNLTSVESSIDKITNSMNSDLFTALPSSDGPVMSCVCHGGDPFDGNETDCLSNGGEWRCQEVSGSAANTFNIDFMNNINSIDNVADDMDGACNKLQGAVEALHAKGVALVAKATGYLEKMSKLSSLSVSTGPCGEIIEALIPDEAKSYLPLISNALKGLPPQGGGESCVCHGGDPFDGNEADCISNGGEWRCQTIESDTPITSNAPYTEFLPTIPQIPTIPTSTVTNNVKIPINISAKITTVELNTLSSISSITPSINTPSINTPVVNGIGGNLFSTISNKISSLVPVNNVSSSVDTSGFNINSIESSFNITQGINSPALFNGNQPEPWTKADGSKMTRAEIDAAQAEYM